jgi:hypothetical protein
MEAAERQVRGRWDYFLGEDEEFRQKLRDFGLKVLVPTDAELKAFAKAIREDVWPPKPSGKMYGPKWSRSWAKPWWIDAEKKWACR